MRDGAPIADGPHVVRGGAPHRIQGLGGPAGNFVEGGQGNAPVDLVAAPGGPDGPALLRVARPHAGEILGARGDAGGHPPGSIPADGDAPVPHGQGLRSAEGDRSQGRIRDVGVRDPAPHAIEAVEERPVLSHCPAFLLGHAPHGGELRGDARPRVQGLLSPDAAVQGEHRPVAAHDERAASVRLRDVVQPDAGGEVLGAPLRAVPTAQNAAFARHPPVTARLPHAVQRLFANGGEPPPALAVPVEHDPLVADGPDVPGADAAHGQQRLSRGDRILPAPPAGRADGRVRDDDRHAAIGAAIHSGVGARIRTRVGAGIRARVAACIRARVAAAVHPGVAGIGRLRPPGVRRPAQPVHAAHVLHAAAELAAAIRLARVEALRGQFHATEHRHHRGRQQELHPNDGRIGRTRNPFKNHTPRDSTWDQAGAHSSPGGRSPSNAPREGGARAP